MSTVTAAEVRDAVEGKGDQWFTTRSCSICHTLIGYEYRDGALFWNGNCDCPARYAPEPRDWQSVADLINMQSDEKHRARLREVFGLDAPKDAA